MSKQGAPLAYRNENLFSDYFLWEILPEDGKWKEEREVGVEELSAGLEFVTNLYREHKGVIKGWQEQDVRDKFINPILREVLGFHYVTKSSHAGIPDYALYITDEDYKDADTGRVADPYSKAVIGEAKKWELQLDDRSPDTPGFFDNRSPDYQTRMYILTTRAKWGILTNGRIWRLYHEATANKRNVYYEVDLLTFVGSQRNMFADFRHFYLFFRAAAFRQGGFLDEVRTQSIEDARGIGEDLEQNVYRALRILAQGFFDNESNGLDIGDSEHVKKVHDNCLIFLYRILFILYAESLKHLPVDKTYYRDNFSFHKLKHEVEAVMEKRGSTEYFPTRHTLWSSLKDLFDLINEGSEKRGIPRSKLQIPAYNGGLFKPEVHEFLEKNSVDDKTLSQVIDLLARGKTPKSPGKRFINYKELGVTKLGGIYEGLLENKFRIAEDDMVPTRGKKQMWVPLSEVGKQKIIDNEKVKKGELYPVTDRGERKATGSYYTPDYIVRYIVDHTLGPLADEAAEEVAALRPGIEKRIKKLRKDSEKKGESQKKIEKAVEEIQFELVEPYLRLKVLDPAMGSGHFLVYATRYIGERIRDDKNIAEVIPEHSDDEVYWMRRVVERSIFGVDLNYLAVELAKLALWLETFSKDAPLSFLDHHLRQGNSLIGASVEQLKALFPKTRKAKDTKQLDAFELEFSENLRKAVASYKSIETLTTDTIERVKEKERDLETARTLMRRFRELGDVATSTWFGNTVKDKDYQDMFNSLSSDETWDKVIRSRDWFKEADSQWHEASPKFFHWELEFPEVFFDEQGRHLENPGFDAVIGNPPYVRIQKMLGTSPKEVNYYKKMYTAAREGNYDLYVVFVERGHSLLCKSGLFGYILPHKFFNSEYGKPLRGYISKGRYLTHVVHFGHQQVFPEATSYTCLLFLRGEETEKCHFVKVDDLERWRTSGEATEGNIVAENITETEWNFVVGKGNITFDKLKGIGSKLGNLVDFFVGQQTSADPVYLFERFRMVGSTCEVFSEELQRWEKLERKILKSVIRSGSVNRYWALPTALVLFPYEVKNCLARLLTPEEMQSNYPLAWEYLNKNKTLLENREGGKFKDEFWYRFGRSQNLGMWEQPKIMVPYMISKLASYFDTSDNYYFINVTTGGYGLTPKGNSLDSLYLCGLLNSKVLDFYLKQISTNFRGGYFAANKQYLEQLPIRTINFSKSEDKKLHDDMVNLVQRMLDLNKRKQEITRNYIAWLESVTGAKVTDLSGKDALSAPENLKDIGELIKLLNKNRNKLKTFDPKVYRDLEKLTANFEECKKDLDPVVAEIEKTDREIDCLVYKLYGLTPEEIEIVEGGPNPCKG